MKREQKRDKRITLHITNSKALVEIAQLRDALNATSY